ncbi:MAG: CCDC90 family protein [Candidatus Magnetoovum sp. WYHC-5]|nr:CCDC90 family protein [Candidatus Magnetoovum sp. WYHC-5]
MPKTIELYNLLKDKLGEESTLLLIDTIDDVSTQAKSDISQYDIQIITKELEMKATKEDIAKVREDVLKLEMSMRTEFGKVWAELENKATKEDVAKLREDLPKLEMSMNAGFEKIRSEFRSEFEKIQTEFGKVWAELGKIWAELENKATKEDIAKLREDMLKLEISLRADIEKTRAQIEKAKSETIRWLFLFWASQIGAIFALFKFFLK